MSSERVPDSDNYSETETGIAARLSRGGDRVAESLHQMPPAWFGRDTVAVARELVGKYLVRELDGTLCTSRIVETEAYLESDPASHSHRGRSERCSVMFEAPGTFYVYRIYGVHHCLNVVTEPRGVGCAVLIRALEPLDQYKRLWFRRYPDRPVPQYDSLTLPENLRSITQLTNGPGKLSKALSITTQEFNGHRVNTSPLWIAAGEADPSRSRNESRTERSRRIGISQGTERLWRFFESGNRFVSRRTT